MTLLNFMSNSPVLTFFLSLMILVSICECVEHFTNSGRCPECKKKHDEEDED